MVTCAACRSFFTVDLQEKTVQSDREIGKERYICHTYCLVWGLQWWSLVLIRITSLIKSVALFSLQLRKSLETGQGAARKVWTSGESSCCLFFRDGNLLKTDLLLRVRTTQTGWQIQGCAREYFFLLSCSISMSLQAHASTSTINKYPFLSSVAPLHLQRKHSGGCVFHANTVECSTYLLQS